MLKISIQTNEDWTPKGKRTARVVQTSRGGRQLRWYVSGKIFRCNPPAHLTQEWIEAGA